MMVSFYHILPFVFSLSFTQNIRISQPKIIEDVLSTGLHMDEAYLILSNRNNSNVILFRSNVVVSEGCDFEPMAVVSPKSNVTIIIDTKFAYHFQLESLASNTLLTSYKFAEYGTYLFEVIQRTEEGKVACSIVRIEEPSHYLLPAIIGLILFAVVVIIIEFSYYLYHGRYFSNILANILRRRSTNNTQETMPLMSPLVSSKNLRQQTETLHIETDEGLESLARNDDNELLVESLRPVLSKTGSLNRAASKRFRALDTFRGFSLAVMIFVNYGGGGYSFFGHSVWNGLTLADIVFPWFVWMIGVSIVLSQRSLRTKNIRKRSILIKIFRRAVILFLLGFTTQDEEPILKQVIIFGILQRMALCYFFTAVIVLFGDDNNDKSNTVRFSLGRTVEQNWLMELSNCVFRFWVQWLFVFLITIVWLLITFLLNVPNCPKGYLGPGGKHDHGKYQNCTGGAAGYIDRLFLKDSQMSRCWTCRDIYDTQIPFNPEGTLGTLTGILLCYLGVQAGHSFIHSNRVRSVCTHWLVLAIICGFFGLLLSKGGHSNGWIPINKNLWSLTFVLVLASLGFIILTVLYLVIDVRRWLSGAPFVWLGMNSIVIYIGHSLLSHRFPIQISVEASHTKLMAINLYGVFFWTFVAGFMYRKNIFIAI